MSDETLTADEDQDRELPAVGKEEEKKKPVLVVGVVLLLAAMLIVVAFATSGGDEQVEEKLTDKTEEKFETTAPKTIKLPPVEDVDFNIPEERPLKIEKQPPLPALKVKPELSKEEKARRDYERKVELAKRASKMDVFTSGSETTTGHVNNALDKQKADLLNRLDGMTKSISTAGGFGVPAEASSPAIGEMLKASSPEGVTASIMADRDFKIGQGKMISAVLETAMQSDLPGMVRAVVTEDIYSEDGRRLLLEKGSRVVGEYKGGMKQGVARIFVLWSRIVTPYGVDIMLESPGTGALGRAGLSGEIDSHFTERFGASMLLSVIGAAAAQDNPNAATIELGENFNESAKIALEDSISIKPTFHKNQGDYIKIFVARDLNFKAAYALRTN